MVEAHTRPIYEGFGKKDINGVECPARKRHADKSAWEENWDWSGPHCPYCGHASMEAMGRVTGPIVSGRAFLNEMEDAVKRGSKNGISKRLQAR